MNGGDCGLTVFNLLDGDKVSVHTIVELDFMLNRFVSCSHGNIAHGHVQNLLITGFVYISGINPFLKLISFNVGSGSGSGDNCRICNFGSGVALELLDGDISIADFNNDFSLVSVPFKFKQGMDMGSSAERMLPKYPTCPARFSGTSQGTETFFVC